MAKDTGIKAARGTLYILSRIMIGIIIVVLVFVSFNTAKDSMQVNMLVKDAFALRAQTILLPSEDGSDKEMMNKIFTKRAMQSDKALNNNVYNDFNILNYYQRTDVKTKLVWPWMDRVTVRVTDYIKDITGEYQPIGAVVPNESEEEQENELPDLQPPKWENGIYDVELVKDNNTWRVNSIEFVKAVEDKAIVAPSQSPEAEESAKTPSSLPSADAVQS